MTTVKANGKDVDAAALLAALYNRAKPQGLGFLHYKSEPMTTQEAQRVLDECGRFAFDYLRGRVLKVFERDGEIHRADLFDRDNGHGQFALGVEDALFEEANR